MTDNLNDLQTRIKQARAEGVGDDPPPSAAEAAQAQSVNQGVRAGTELVVPMIVGGGAGYALDNWQGTAPLFFIIFFILGVFVGFWNVYRVVNGLGSEIGFVRLQQKAKQAKETQRFPGTSEED